jgi:hypothetical protein
MIPVRTCLAIFSAMLLAASPLRAAPAREALVIGNGTYTSLPPQPACLRSAHAVAMALRNAGFDVVENEDATSGGIDAAIGAFSKKLAETPYTAAVIYACAYAAVLNDRPFLLPVSARITRPADVLTQGVLAKSLIDALARGNAGASVFALDVVPAPGTPAALGLDSLAQAALPDQLGLIAVNQNSPPEAPTPLAALACYESEGIRGAGWFDALCHSAATRDQQVSNSGCPASAGQARLSGRRGTANASRSRCGRRNARRGADSLVTGGRGNGRLRSAPGAGLVGKARLL